MKFVNWDWKRYDYLRMYPELKEKQVSLLVGSGLIEGDNGIEYAFVPTKKIEQTNQHALELYKKIRVEENEVALCNEVFFTTKIEGADTTIVRTQQLHNGSPINENDYYSEVMVLNCFKATKYLNLITRKMTKETLLNVWGILVDGVCENEDVRGDEWRIGPVSVGKHLGLDYRLLDDAMKNWIEFYNGDVLEEYPLIKAALLHFSFEFIHPFCDGNGRCGRMLMNNYLVSRGFEKIKAVSFSKVIEERHSEYNSALEMGDNVQTDCTAFIEYLLSVFEEAFFDCLEYP